MQEPVAAERHAAERGQRPEGQEGALVAVAVVRGQPEAERREEQERQVPSDEEGIASRSSRAGGPPSHRSANPARGDRRRPRSR